MNFEQIKQGIIENRRVENDSQIEKMDEFYWKVRDLSLKESIKLSLIALGDEYFEEHIPEQFNNLIIDSFFDNAQEGILTFLSNLDLAYPKGKEWMSIDMNILLFRDNLFDTLLQLLNTKNTNINLKILKELIDFCKNESTWSLNNGFGDSKEQDLLIIKNAEFVLNMVL